MEEITTNNTLQQNENELNKLIKYIFSLLTSVKVPENFAANSNLFDDPDFKKLYDAIIALRELTSALAKGELQRYVIGKGYIISNLKALQSDLQHLTWQSKMVASGDFSQRVDFLGDFSKAFNEMTIKLQNSKKELVELATTDALTSVPNRLALSQFISKAFKISAEQDTPLSIVIFDIDFFKKVNDTYGHDSGDKVLVKVSELLNSQFRSNDIFSRYGGEEFMAVLNASNKENALKIAERAIKLVEKTEITLNTDTRIWVTVSAGISSRLPEDKTYEDIIKRSDIALYEAKTGGRNRVCTA